MDRLQISVSLLGLTVAFVGAPLSLIHAMPCLTLIWFSEAYISDARLRRKVNVGQELICT